jgi:hypothetical protein
MPGYTATTPAVAVSLAQELHNAGLFAGTGVDQAGRPAFELDRPLTRIEALAVILRLLGLEDEAYASTAPNPFKDVPEWGDRLAAHAYSIGLTVGVNEERTLLAADRPASTHEFTVFLLRVLGYFEASGDFRYSDALKKAADVGLLKAEELERLGGDSQFLRAEAVFSIAKALLANVKQSDARLVDTLAGKGKLPKESADALVESLRALLGS